MKTRIEGRRGQRNQDAKERNIDQQFQEGREFVRETLRSLRSSKIPEPYRPLVKHLLKG
jgi:hypothetical protein